MKKITLRIADVLAGVSLIAAIINASSVCCHYAYQAPIPESLRKRIKMK